MDKNRASEILHPAESFILRLRQQPRIFDFRGWPFAGEHVGDFARRMGLAVDVRFVRVGCGVASNDHIRQREQFMIGRQRFRSSVQEAIFGPEFRLELAA